MKIPRKNSLVRCTNDGVRTLFDGDLLFLGQIPNMPQHCAIASKDGRVTWGWHTDNFVELSEEEV